VVRQGCALHLQKPSSNSNVKSQSSIPREGGALWVCGDAVNPSMGAWSPHPCGSHPANLRCPAFDRFTRLLVGADRWSAHLSDIEFQIGVRARCAATGSDPVPTNGRHPPEQNAVPTDRGGLSKAGWVRLRGCEPHGPEACLGRVGQDAQPRSCRVRRTAHTSMRRPSPHGWVHGVPAHPQCPAIPRNAALAFDVEVASAGAGLQALPIPLHSLPPPNCPPA